MVVTPVSSYVYNTLEGGRYLSAPKYSMKPVDVTVLSYMNSSEK